MPDDFSASLFNLPLKHPTLVRTKIGWHLIEVLEKKAGEARTFEEAQEEVVAALEARKRSDGLQLYRMQLREFEKLKVEIYEDFMN